MACMAKRGFLTLRNCDNPEAQTCETCGRPMCTEHLSARSGYKQCLECASAGVDLDTDPNLDPEWAASYRRDYYRRSGYSPIDFALMGAAGSYWNGVDRRAFRANAAGRNPLDEDREPGFGDS
jgi:hypothetical protein